MNQRKVFARLLSVYQEEIERLACESDELEFASSEWQKVAKKHYAERMKRQGARELAFVLGVIDEDEYGLYMSDLIEKLEAE